MANKTYMITLSETQYKKLIDMVSSESTRLSRVASEYDEARETAMESWGKPFHDYVTHQSSSLWDEALMLGSIHTKLLVAKEVDSNA